MGATVGKKGQTMAHTVQTEASVIGGSGAGTTFLVTDVYLSADEVYELLALVIQGGQITSQSTEGDLVHVHVKGRIEESF